MNSKIKKLAVQSLKIAVGGSTSIFIAEALGLSFAPSAGIITMLTLVTTKWETLKLSLFRVLTFWGTVLLAWVLFQQIESDWIAFGIFLFLLVAVFERTGMKPTVAANAVIGTHFLQTHDFSRDFILNEFFLVLIGILMAIFLNLFQNNGSRRKQIIRNMRDTEKRLQEILKELSSYLLGQESSRDVWEDLNVLDTVISEYEEEAYEYLNNTFQSHPTYYLSYFEMRKKQCTILYTLHQELKNVRSFPRQAAVVGEYMTYLTTFVKEMNDPLEQMRRLEGLFDQMKEEELPKTREEFESRARLYHVLSDLEEFLLLKRTFVDMLDERQLRIYWDQESLEEKSQKK